MAFTESPIPAVAPGLDLAQVDDKLRQLGTIESSWGLPLLPDEVKLDLVSHPALGDRQGLGDFLYGLASDVNDALNPLAAKPAAAQAAPEDPSGLLVPQQPSNTGPAGLIADVAGFARPEVVAPDSVFNFKREAISKGLLPADTPLDARWDPSFNAVAADLRNEQFRQRLAGKRGGSWTINDAMHLIDEWTAPSNLLHAAYKLDFLIDPHAVGKETSGWGNKWRHWWKNKTSPRAFVDALTGPIDDVAVPILNDALLITGASEVIGGIRAAYLGAEAAPEVATGLRALYSARTAMEAGEAAVRGTREAGVLSRFLETGGSRLLGTTTAPLAQGTGAAALRASEGMQAWRNLRGVKLASLGLQQGLRLGIAGTLESKVFPHQGYVKSIEEFKSQGNVNTPLGLAFDLLSIPFFPEHILPKGSLAPLGRPAAALASRYRTVVREAGATVETANAWAKLIEDPAEREAFTAAAKKDPAQALVDHLGGSEEKAGHLVSWAATLTAIDADSVALANRVAKDDPARWKQVFLANRNGRIAQLRHIDEGDEETFLQIMREKGAGRKSRQFKARLADPAQRDAALADMNALIGDHNLKRDGAFQQLIGGLQPGQIESHVSTVFRNATDWDAFLVANDELRQMVSQEGLLDAAPTYKAPLQEGGGDPEVRRLVASVMDDPNAVSRAWLQPFARDIVPGRGRFTIARAETVTKQDAVEVLATVKAAQRRLDALSWLEHNPDKFKAMVTTARGLNQPLHDLSPRQVVEAMRGVFASGITDTDRAAARALRAVSAEGLDPLQAASITQAKANIQAQLDSLNQHRMWSDWFNIPSHLSFDDKVKQLGRLQSMLAAEVQGLPTDKVQALAKLGYKVVHGAEFLTPNDLLDLVRPLADTSRLTMAQYSLGTFLHPVEDKAVWGLINRRLHGEMTDVFARLGVTNPEVLARSYDSQNGDVQATINRLYDFIRGRQEVAAQAVQQSEESGGLGQKLLANLHSSLAPHGLRDIRPKELNVILQGTPLDGVPGAVNAVRDAILNAHDVGWRYNGLASIEDHMRAHGVLVDGLKLLSRTASGESLRKAAGVGGVLGAGMGAMQGWAQGEDPVEILGSALGGGLAGAATGAGFGLAGRGLGGLAESALPRVAGSNWDRYTRLPESLVRLRNTMRFTLSPFFDLRRYTKGAVIAQLHELPEDVRLPLFGGVRTLKKDFGPEGVSEARRMWSAATRGEYGLVDETERYFRTKGILGYSPMDYQAGAYYRMVKAGVDPEQAYTHTKAIYAYGLGRSPAEKSANFIFFPFSFEKKLVTNAGRFLSSDLSRTLFLHDALKTYDVLNERYNLSERWEKHLPVLHELQKLNAFEHGISPGELGGINRPLIDPVLGPAIQAFLPHGVILEDKSHHEKLVSLMKRMVPVYNDTERMLDDLGEQGHVLFSPSHITTRAEVDEGYAWWHAFKSTLDQQAKALGYHRGYASIVTSPTLAPVKEQVEAFKADLGRRYPAWMDARAKLVGRLSREDEELNMLVERPETDGERKLAFFAQVEKQLRSYLSDAGYSIANAPEDVPPDVYSAVRQLAAELAADGGEFRGLYGKFYAHLYGPITRST